MSIAYIVRPKHPGALPIIITHGGRAEDAFHVVVPSLPGFGWSDKPSSKGWNTERVAKTWAALMGRLGYSRWVAQDGDWGSVVTHTLGHQRPAGLIAAHVNLPFVFPDVLPPQPTPDEAAAIAAAKLLVNDGLVVGQFESQTDPLSKLEASFTHGPLDPAITPDGSAAAAGYSWIEQGK